MIKCNDCPHLKSVPGKERQTSTCALTGEHVWNYILSKVASVRCPLKTTTLAPTTTSAPKVKITTTTSAPEQIVDEPEEEVDESKEKIESLLKKYEK